VEGLLACDTSKVEHVIAELAALNYKGIVCIRSTVPVGFTARQARQYKDMKFVFFPEFLRESSPVMDALTPSRHVLGYPECDQSIVPIELADLLMDRFPGVPVLNMTSDEAELVKLALNAFWAVKVSVFNELRGISDKLGLDWEAIRRGMLTDGRITQDHTQVPGPDGKRGFGGKCLPKDLANLIHCAQGLGLPVPILEAVWLRNCSLDRPSVNPGGVA
jgi:UDPglucose 6-dehydrogenase